MANLIKEYNTVFLQLQKFCSQLRRASLEVAEKKSNIHNQLNLLEKQMQVQLSEIVDLEQKIQAFVEVARAHTVILNKSQWSLPLDRSKLTALMVRIDSSSTVYDPNAEKLFTEATGQLMTCSKNKRDLEQKYKAARSQLNKQEQDVEAHFDLEKSRIRKEIKGYFNSREFNQLILELQNDFQLFGNNQISPKNNNKLSHLSLGIKMLKFPLEDDFLDLVSQTGYQFFDPAKKLIGLPVEIDLHSGEGLIFEYSNETEAALLDGVQNMLFNLVRFWGDEIEQIIFMDPIRFNNSALGILEPLASEMGSLIDAIPVSIEAMRKKLASVISNFALEEKRRIHQPDAVFPRRIFYFHDFPQGYDSTMVSQIQQLFMSAERYNITVIIANNLSTKSMTGTDILEYMGTLSNKISCSGKEFFTFESSEKVPFCWYRAPKALPQSLLFKYAGRKKTEERNIYEQIFNLERTPSYLKGRKTLPDIPVGVDEEGNIISLNFENSNFATFICGAARSGKSTLLHTILTGLIRNVHPDDVEIWLIDFKMTEFSRYMKHLPPHVRYIILDESPELVYDIIDRLMEILFKRQNRFKENWLKLADVPPEKYMPAIFVIIDEFSIMSNIIANSVNSKKDYKEKMQILLAKGAALGFHFIFSSQGFTSGTNGLSDFSKKQIQQRIAMKTEYNEIRETLDLRSLNDEDRVMMEQLQPYYALLRVQEDEKGSHLCKIKTIYIKDYKKQDDCIDMISESVRKNPKYDVFDPKVYIDKRSMIVDGGHYHAFFSEKEKIIEYISQNADVAQEMEETYLFPGKPKKMAELYPLEIFNGFCENILVFAPVTEKQPLASLLTSLMESLNMQNKSCTLWTTPRNMAYRTLLSQLRRFSCPVYRDIDEVCSQILQIKNEIKIKKTSDQYIFLLGAETLLLDMSFQTDLPADSQTSKKNPGEGIFVEKREEGEMDIETLLQSLGFGVEADKETKNNENDVQVPTLQGNTEDHLNTTQAYDARNDLKYILAQGPRLGYHFILVFNTVEEFQQSRIDLSLFKHKLLFRMAKIDALTLVGGAEADWIAGLNEHTFRYTNGLDSLSFQPYLYSGLSWDGWEVQGETAVNTTEEEYLM